MLSSKILLFVGVFVISYHEGKGFVNSLIAESTKKIGCHHNGTVYADGSLVPTLEPCLSCKCMTKTLICSLKICPEMPVPPPRGCILIQKKNSCCPYLSCSKFNTLPSTLNRRIIAYLDHIERETLDRIVSENSLRRRSDDFELDGSDEICIQNGTVYKSGSAMSSSSLCSYCYCIGGTQKCVKPKCVLSMEGCKPIFVDSACCPVRYDCTISKSSSVMKSQNHARKTGNKHYQRTVQRLQRSRGCIVNTVFYSEGQKIPSMPDKPCDICFCIRGSRKCAPKKCAPSIRNCLPVVPKGQCCPSSYDCGYIKDMDRAFKSRQFDLFSLLFGSEDDNTTGEAQFNATYQNNSETVTNLISTTSEKSIFDAIREGLEFIDSNHKLADNLEDIQLAKENITLSAINENNDHHVSESTVNLTDTLLTSSESSDENLNVFDFFVDNSNSSGNDKENQTSMIIEKDYTSQEKSESNEDEINDTNYLIVTVVNGTHETPEYLQTTDFILNSEITQNKNNYYSTPIPLTDDDYGSTTENDEITTENFVTEFSDFNEEESTTISDFTNFYDVINVTTTEINENNLKNTTDNKSVATTERLPIIQDSTEVEYENQKVENSSRIRVSEIVTKTHNIVTEIYPASQNSVRNATFNITTLEKKPEKDFLSVFFDGLSTILQENGNNTNLRYKNMTETIKTSNFTLNSNSNRVTTIYPNGVSTISPNVIYQKVNTKFSGKPSSTTTFDRGTLFSIPIHSQPNEGISTNIKLKGTVKPLPMIIKTNPSILETDYDFDYNVPTLPPSLPNLKIIPFLPADAVKKHQTDFNYYPPAPPISDKRTNSWMLPPIVATDNHHYQFEYPGRYPTITEHTPGYESINRKGYGYDDYDYSDFEISNEGAQDEFTSGGSEVKSSGIEIGDIKFVSKYQEPIKKYDVGVMEFDRAPYKGTINVKTTPNYSFEALQINSGFSPPTKTEGGFVPKEPIIDELFYENLYTTNKFLIDLTTSAPTSKMNTTNTLIAEINVPDPFKDVIKTEPPPDLHSLIEDKEKLLANEFAINDFEQIISITTDSSYNNNETVECKTINNTSSNCSEKNIFEVNEMPPFENSELQQNHTLLSNDSETTKTNIPVEEKIIEKTLNSITESSNFTNNSSSEEKLNMDFNSAFDSIFGFLEDDEYDQSSDYKNSTIEPNSKVMMTTTTQKTEPSIIDKMNDYQSITTESPSEDLSILKEALLSSFDSQPSPLFDTESYKNEQHSTENTQLLSSSSLPPLNENIVLSEPFNKLPFMRPSYPIKQSNVNTPLHNFDLIFPGFKTNAHKDRIHQPTHQVLAEDSIISNTESYVVNPVDIDKLKEHTIVRAEIFTKPENSNRIKDPAGILKLAGCNIYGRMYRVGRIISELSGPCLECKCTEVGVNCTPLTC